MSSKTFTLRGSGATGTGEIIIVDAGIIATITDEANWDDTGFTGSTAGLVTGNAYYDNVLSIRYHFNGTILTRTPFNTI